MLQICIGDYHLCQDCTKSLADTGSTGIDMKLSVLLKHKFHTACIRDTDTNTGIFHGTSKAHRYTHAVVLPTKPGATNKWDAVGCRASLKSAQALLAQERRRIAKYNQKTAAALRVVELEARP